MADRRACVSASSDEVARQRKSPVEAAGRRAMLATPTMAEDMAAAQAQDRPFNVFADATLGLELMFETEQSLHDTHHTSVNVGVLTASGIAQCAFPVDSNMYGALENMGL